LERARINVGRDPFEGSFVPRVCRQCSHARCMAACPNGAMVTRGEDGVVVVDRERCVGCGKCAKACPFDAVKIDKAKKTAIKCDLCGGRPKCVQWCPTSALGIAEYGEGKL